MSGQDPNDLPYDPTSSITAQVQSSLRQSPHNLRPTNNDLGDEAYVDCLILHSPLSTFAETLEAWIALESFVPHKVRRLGLSNINLPMLSMLYEATTIKPMVVQNRFYQGTEYDVPVRALCRETGILYEAFWTVSANPQLLHTQPVLTLSSGLGIEKAVALYALIVGLGNTAILNGTTNMERMKNDLEGLAETTEWASLEASSKDWETAMKQFRSLVDTQDSV